MHFISYFLVKNFFRLEAEQALLGSILVNNDIIDEVSTIINPSSFYDPAHTKVYEVIEILNNKGMIANPITLNSCWLGFIPK